MAIWNVDSGCARAASIVAAIALLLIGTVSLVAGVAGGGTIAFGLQHTPLGQAQLQDVGGRLTVSNIGSSGKDGVSIDIGEAQGHFLTWGAWPAGAMPAGSELLFDYFIFPPAVPDPQSWCFALRETQGGQTGVGFEPDASPPNNIELQLLLDDQIVFQQTFLPPFPPQFCRTAGIGSAGMDHGGAKARHARDRGFVFYDVILLAQSPVTVSGGPTVVADEITLKVDDDPTIPCAFNQVSLKATGLQQIDIFAEALVAFDDLHSALGQAHLRGENGHLTVSNIGSSGLDGVTIDQPCNIPCNPCVCRRGFELDFGALGPGGRIWIYKFTDAPPALVGGRDGNLWYCYDRLVGGAIGDRFELFEGAVVPAGIELRAFLGNQLVDHTQLAPPYPTHLVVSNIGSSGKDGVRHSAGSGGLGDGCDGNLLIETENPVPTSVELAGSAIGAVTADRYRMCLDLGVNGPWEDRVDFIEVLGQNIPEFTILDEFEIPLPCNGDTNDDGQVDIDDIVNVVLDFGCGEPGDPIQPPCPNGGDVNGDGVVNIDDIVVVVLNFGPCPGAN